ncbi:MAG TPA: bifunctional DNA-formamidopyrimidine glycosylase/DNA-(apurinic or apyrimidinic site) lyase, partial [Thermomicrobiales bacterium]|nr:bifunctional DNA-formamidopyrimidine glycosylase/DNA-(apurinic or apyrimidinic site) lyase [Thermomicrobiales bacterium]
MPELPEVETVRAIIEREASGRTIAGVTFRAFPGVVGLHTPEQFAALVTDRTIQTPVRRGKFLLLPLDDETALVVHLRMTGRLLVTAADVPPVRFEHLALHLDNDADLRFSDQRKFGRVLHMLRDDAERSLSRLGPEPLSPHFNARYLAERANGRTAPVKSFLLDQRHIAGLGNIYVDEALFLSRIHPLAPAGALTERDITSLVRSIRKVLRASIANQGTTFATFENPYGERGNNAGALKVYGRAK